MSIHDDHAPVEIFSGTIWETQLLKSLLENAEIEAYLKDENIGTLFPWYTAPGGAGSVTVMVPAGDYNKAMTIVNEFRKNQNNNTTPQPD